MIIFISLINTWQSPLIDLLHKHIFMSLYSEDFYLLLCDNLIHINHDMIVIISNDKDLSLVPVHFSYLFLVW